MRTTTFTTTAAALLLVAGVVQAGGAAATTAGRAPVEPAAVVTAPGAYNALTPARVLDSRDGTGGYTTPFVEGTARTLQVTGQGGVPTSGAGAVVLNVTVTDPTFGGYLTVYGSGAAPTASNLNFVAGQTVANLVTVPLSSTGTVSLYASGGQTTRTVDVVADVAGWYASGTPTTDGAFGPLGPTRLLDTRTDGGPVAGGGTRTLAVAGVKGVPTDAGAVVVNVTAVNPTALGYLTAFPTGSRPDASTLNFVAGQTVPNLATVPLAGDGSVSFHNGSGGPTDVVVDVVGFLLGAGPSRAGMTGALTPARVLDTRSGVGGAQQRLAGQSTLRVAVVGRGGVPTSGVGAVVVNVTAVLPDAPVGYLTVFPGSTPPLASNLNFVAGSTVPNLVVVPVAADGTIAIFNGAAAGTSVDVVADVTAYVRSADLTVPDASTSRYVSDLSATQTDAQITATMKAHGQADGADATGSGAHLSILEFGAQSAKAGGDGLGGGNQNGVSLVAQSAPGMRLTYAQVQTAVKGYLDGYVLGRPSSATGRSTVALGTNTDGFAGASYTPGAKGVDWAGQVVAAATYASQKSYADLSVVGADDIEADFDATAAEVKAWIAGYRSVSNPPALINNGAASGCPTTLGAAGQSCGAVPVANSNPATTNTWSQSDYVAFSTGTGISIAPQIYLPVQAAQWENIVLTAQGDVTFAGVLTSVEACTQTDECSSLSPSQAWAEMEQALGFSTTTDDITVPAISDIRYP